MIEIETRVFADVLERFRKAKAAYFTPGLSANVEAFDAARKEFDSAAMDLAFDADHGAPKDYATRFCGAHSPSTVAKSAELQSLLSEQTNGGE